MISMTDINSIPPKNFKFFYQSKKVPGWDENNRLEYQKGYVEISYKNKTWLADVPYDIYGDFLSKFDIFTEIWASTKGDDMWANCR